MMKAKPSKATKAAMDAADRAMERAKKEDLSPFQCLYDEGLFVPRVVLRKAGIPEALVNKVVLESRFILNPQSGLETSR